MSKVESVTPPPDNNELSSLSTMDSQSNGHGLFSKSRNARAQARHRAKRKAYIEQLEESVTKLQSTLATQECRVTGLSAFRMAELEKENVALHQEIFHLRNQIADLTRVTPPSHLQGPQHSQNDDSSLLHESKRRKRSIEEYLGADVSQNLSGRDDNGGLMHPGTLRDVPRYSQSVTPPTHSPGPRPQLQLYVPQCGYHLDGPYSNTGHPLSGSNAMAYASYNAQKSLDTSMNSYQNVTSPTVYDYRQSTPSASSTPSSLIPSPISTNGHSNSQDPWSNPYVAPPGEGQTHHPPVTHHSPSHVLPLPHWSTRPHIRSPHITHVS